MDRERAEEEGGMVWLVAGVRRVLRWLLGWGRAVVRWVDRAEGDGGQGEDPERIGKSSYSPETIVKDMLLNAENKREY